MSLNGTSFWSLGVNSVIPPNNIIEVYPKNAEIIALQSANASDTQIIYPLIYQNFISPFTGLLTEVQVYVGSPSLMALVANFNIYDEDDGSGNNLYNQARITFNTNGPTTIRLIQPIQVTANQTYSFTISVGLASGIQMLVSLVIGADSSYPGSSFGATFTVQNYIKMIERPPIMIIPNNNDAVVVIGSLTPTPGTVLDIQSTTGALSVPRMSSAQRIAINASNGMIVYDTDTNLFYFYQNDAWTTFLT
jgi:hypothetical protein